MGHPGIWTPPHGLKFETLLLHALWRSMSAANDEYQAMELFDILEDSKSLRRNLAYRRANAHEKNSDAPSLSNNWWIFTTAC